MPSMMQKPSRSKEGRASAPASETLTPISTSGETATLAAWKSAQDTYKKSLAAKDLEQLMIPTGPEDVLNSIEEWQRESSARRHAKVADSIRAGTVPIKRFSDSIGLMAQGSPAPACLLWGNIKFVLTIVQDAAEEYEKLSKALSHMVECMPRIELYTETFMDSELIKHCVGAFYVSVLRFWTRACKFYRRRRLWNFGRVLWKDFDAEFGDLAVEMHRTQNHVESTAIAEHIRQSEVARAQQHAVNWNLLNAQSLAREKEIMAWLAPTNYDVKYYMSDLRSARELRHPKTCQWVFEKQEIVQLWTLTQEDPKYQDQERSLLWIYARPGSGKTVLASRLIDHYAQENVQPYQLRVFYFFCKSTDIDKNTSISVMRSLLYQLYESTKDQGLHELLKEDIERVLDKSGQSKAVNFATLWQLFFAHITHSQFAMIILDALDECKDPELLIESLNSLHLSVVRTIIISRKEGHLDRLLSNNISFEITPDDVNADINAFIEAKISASRQLSNSLVRDEVFSRLSSCHDGLFLWVCLTLKELKSCVSVDQVRKSLIKLPTGLEETYKNVLQRLRSTLNDPTLGLCTKVLTWVVCAVRPLRLDELKHALTIQYEIDDEILLSDDNGFPYSDKDIELVCGSLVAARNGTLQVIHLTVKEFLRSSHHSATSPYSELLVDSRRASLQLTLVCLKCIETSCLTPLIDLDSEIHRIDLKLDRMVPLQRRLDNPLVEYASFSWLVHLIDCDTEYVSQVSRAFQKAFDSSLTFTWLEICMVFQPDSVFHLLVGLDEIVDWISNSKSHRHLENESSSHFLAIWCGVLQDLLQEYGTILAHRPWEVHFLDLHNIFGALSGLYERFGNTAWRDVTIQLNQYKCLQPSRIKAPPYRQLSLDGQGSSSRKIGIFFFHDEKRSLYFWGNRLIEIDHKSLYIQNAITGQRLPPVVDLDGESEQSSHLISCAMSRDGGYIAATYSSRGSNGWSIIVWRIVKHLDFKRRMHSEPWAQVIFTHYFNPMVNVRNIVFSDDGHCLTPFGKIHLASASGHALPEDVTLSEENPQGFATSFYDGTGRCLFISGKDHIQKITPYETSPPITYSWNDTGKYLDDISPSGRYVILYGRYDMKDVHAQKKFFMYDTKAKKTIKLTYPILFDSDIRSYGHRHFFSSDETRLFAFNQGKISGIATMLVAIWNKLSTGPKLQSYGCVKIDTFITKDQICMNIERTSALMVLNDRSIQSIRFDAEVGFPDVVDVNDEYPCNISFISKDGVRCAFLSYGQQKGQIQLIDLTRTKAPIRRLNLTWKRCNNLENLTVGLSPDLHVLVVDGDIFDIAAPEGSLATLPFSLQGLPDLFEQRQCTEKIDGWCRLECHVSSCNSYVLYISEGNPWAKERCPNTVFVFHIDTASRSSNRLDLQLPDDLARASATFHPSLPLMVLGYEINVKYTQTGLGRHVFFIVNLESLEMKPVEMPAGYESVGGTCQDFFGDRTLPFVLFSDCGTFLFIEFPWRPQRWFQVLLRFSVDPSPARFIRHNRDIRYYKYRDRGYSNYISGESNSLIGFEDTDNASARLKRVKPAKHYCIEGYMYPPIYLEDLVVYPSSMIEADRFLLLGANDDEKMRLFTVPHDGRVPEIRTLSLSFADAKARLEKQWEIRRTLEQKAGQDNILDGEDVNEVGI